ncbi:MAG TPA: hypothetical protein VIT38_03590 [Allosphingosinicella sp.]
MGGIRKFLTAAALLAALPGPAFAQNMCVAVNRIAAAGREPVPFLSLEREVAKVVIVPGFRAGTCRVEPGTSISCSRNLAPRSLDVEELGPVLRDCLQAAPAPAERFPPDPRLLVFIAEGLRYEIHNNCTDTCRAGMLASFRVTMAPRAD